MPIRISYQYESVIVNTFLFGYNHFSPLLQKPIILFKFFVYFALCAFSRVSWQILRWQNKMKEEEQPFWPVINGLARHFCRFLDSKVHKSVTFENYHYIRKWKSFGESGPRTYWSCLEPLACRSWAFTLSKIKDFVSLSFIRSEASGATKTIQMSCPKWQNLSKWSLFFSNFSTFFKFSSFSNFLNLTSYF